MKIPRTFSFNKELIERLDRVAEATKLKKTTIVEMAIDEKLKEYEKEIGVYIP